MSKVVKEEYKKNENIKALAIDSHAHLDRYENADEIISRMKADGLESIVLMAGSKESAEWTSNFVAKRDNLYFMYGIHPFDIDEYSDTEMREFFIKHNRDSKLVGLGEIGLDYSRQDDEETKNRQKKILILELLLANEFSLPVSIHIRDAHPDAINIFKENRRLLTNGGIIHCCSATKEEVKEYLALGFHISFSGTITYGKKNNEYYLEETLKCVPLDKLLIETDCPFLCPAPYRGQINEPKYVLVTAEKVAEVLEMDVNELISKTTENAKRLLKIK